jgi:tripartite-type tricarboxylate transporter receptor subunit TctC
MRQRRLALPALLASLVLVAAGCGGDDGGGDGGDAESYPSRQITLTVPYAPGGPTDLAGRTIGDYLQRDLGQTVVVENRPGASGSLGMQAMISAGNDGHAMSLIAVPATATNPLQLDVGYDNDDYIPIAAVTEIPSVLAVGANSPYADAEALFEAARQNPGQVTVGVPGTTTSQAMEIRRMAEEYDVELNAIPFDGNAEMTSALLGQNVDSVFINASQDVLENIEAGQFVPLAQSPAERVSYLEDVPTLAESGFEELTSSVSLFGLAVPAGTDDAIVQRLEDSVRDALEDPQVVERLDERYVPQEFIGREAFEERIDAIVEAYGPILQQE